MNAVAFNEESSIVFSGSMDGTMQAWDNRSRSEKAVQVNSFGVSIFILTKHKVMKYILVIFILFIIKTRKKNFRCLRNRPTAS